MRDQINAIKKYRYPILLVVGLIILLLLANSTIRNNPDQNEQKAYNDRVLPGRSSVEDMTGILGEPLKTTKFSEFTIFHYPSSIQNYTTQIYTEDDMVELVKEPVRYAVGLTVEQLQSELGEPSNIYYSKEFGGGYQLDVYQEIGFAALFSENSGVVVEQWYFDPNSPDDFLSKWSSLATDKIEDEPEKFE